MKFPSSILALICSVSILPATSHAAEAAANQRDPQALAALRKMSGTLAAAKALSYRSRSAFQVLAKNGQYITVFSTADVALKRPDKLRATLTGDAPHFDFFYDGRTAAAFSPLSGIYSVAKAPPTIDEMLPALEEETGIRLATAGLLFSNPYEALLRGVTSALYLGRVRLNGSECEHLAFRGNGVDWEIWIDAGGRQLPRRLAVTFGSKRPVVVDFLSWEFHPALRPGDFAFSPPPGAREIPFRALLKN